VRWKLKLRLLALFSMRGRDIEPAVFNGGSRPEAANDDGDGRARQHIGT